MGNKAVFLDRDGTINEEVGYVNHIERFILLPRVPDAIRLLNQRGIKVIVITNQSGVARGYFPESLIFQVHKKMEELLRQRDAFVDGIYYCPHHPKEGFPPYLRACKCRKPETGLVDEAVKAFDIDCRKSYMIGDRGVDIEFGHKIGAKPILVLTGYGKGEWEYNRYQWKVMPCYVASDLYDAVEWIIKQED